MARAHDLSRRAFLASTAALAVGPSTLASESPPEYLLVGDSLAYVLAPAFRAEAKKHRVPVEVVAHGGSSVRQWLRKHWLEKALTKYPNVREVMISLGTNCTRVERPKITEDVQKLVLVVNDVDRDKEGDAAIWSGTAPIWLLPPPMPKFDTQYLFDAVAACEVFAFSPGTLPLESDGIHPTLRGCQMWARKIAEFLWE